MLREQGDVVVFVAGMSVLALAAFLAGEGRVRARQKHDIYLWWPALALAGLGAYEWLCLIAGQFSDGPWVRPAFLLFWCVVMGCILSWMAQVWPPSRRAVAGGAMLATVAAGIAGLWQGAEAAAAMVWYGLGGAGVLAALVGGFKFIRRIEDATLRWRVGIALCGGIVLTVLLQGLEVFSAQRYGAPAARSMGLPLALVGEALAAMVFLSTSAPQAALIPGSLNRRRLFWFMMVGVSLVMVSAAAIAGFWGRQQHAACERKALAETQALSERMQDMVIRVVDCAEGLSISPRVIPALLPGAGPEALASVNDALDRYAQAFGMSVCYVMDPQGLTIAASNRQTPESFVGKNYGFRPYFQDAVRGGLGRYFAHGVTSGKRGFYAAAPVYDAGRAIVGVAVVKLDVEFLRESFRRYEAALLLDPYGVVFVASDSSQVQRSLFPLSEQVQEQLVKSRQHATEKFLPLLDREYASQEVVAYSGLPHYFLRKPLGIDGWSVASFVSYVPVGHARLFGMGIGMAIGLMLLAAFIILARREEMLAVIEQTGARLREQEQWLRHIMDTARVGIVIVEAPTQRIVDINQTALEYTGAVREAIQGQPYRDFWGPADAAAAEELTAEETAVSVEGALCRIGRSCIPVLRSTVRVTISGCDYFIVSFVDISERKRMEEDLARSQTLIETVVENARAFIVLTDRDGRIMRMNRFGRGLLGSPQDNRTGTPAAEMFAPQQREQAQAVFRGELPPVAESGGFDPAGSDKRRGRQNHRVAAYRAAGCRRHVCRRCGGRP